MYTVELIDDEYNNIKLLNKLAAWEQLGFTIAGDASDGQDGLELFQRIRPDVVIVDIKMPIMDGLECIRRIRRLDQQVILIVLSAFGEFEYAQESIRYGVYTYLLKPVNRTQLNDMLAELKQHLDERRSQTETMQTLQNKLAVNEFHQLLFQCLESDCQKPELTLRLAELLTQQEYLIISCRLRCTASQQSESETDRSLIASLQEHLIQNGDRVPYTFSDPNYGNLLLIEHPLAEQLAADQISRFLNQLENWEYDICIFRKVLTGSDLKTKLSGCLTSQSFCFYSSSSSLSLNPLPELSPYVHHLFPLPESENYIIKAVAGCQKEILLQHLEELFKTAQESKVHPQDLKEFCFDLLLSLKKQLTSCYQGKTFDTLRSIHARLIYSCFRFEELRQFLDTMIHQAFDALQFVGGMDKSTALLYQASEFTKNHFMRADFSVQLVAEYINLSKNYFLKLYRETNQHSFWDDVTQLRLQYAKQLLTNTDKTLPDISQAIGYESEFHFSRRFKEFSGLTPAQYRKKMKQGE